VAWQGADWDGKASSSGGKWKPCPSELRYAPKDVSPPASCKDVQQTVSTLQTSVLTFQLTSQLIPRDMTVCQACGHHRGL
jgi:hypothetical protein